jgi:hypothetical protein
MMAVWWVQHIDTGSAKPLIDLCAYGFVFSYTLSWPREYAHYKHEQVGGRVRALGWGLAAEVPVAVNLE